MPTARQQIGADGQQRRAGPQRERGRAGGQRRALAEELHGDPVACEVAVAHEAHHPVRAQRPHDAPGCVRPERDDVHPEAAPRLDEPVEQFGRLDRFGHDDRRVAAGREPGAGVVVVAEVRQSHDRAAAGPIRGLDVLEALTLEVGLDRRRGLVLEPEELVPVPPVVVEHRAHRPFELGTLQTSSARADEVAPDLRPLDGPGVHHGTRRRAGPRVAERVREHRARGQRRPGTRDTPRGRGRRTRCLLSLIGVSGAGEPAALRLPSEPDPGAAPGDDAWRQTITKRWTAVTSVSTSITQSTGMRTSNASPMPSSTIRSARSMNPPRAEKPRDSALARSYETSIEAASTARARTGAPGLSDVRCQATPPSTRASDTRSTTESKNAPRGPALPL